jgi:hypothetical protein
MPCITALAKAIIIASGVGTALALPKAVDQLIDGNHHLHYDGAETATPSLVSCTHYI